MARRAKLKIDEEIAPNLIPMIDIMFLLLLFFMLGADMGQRDIEDVALPEASAIKEDKEAKGKDKDRLTINLYHRPQRELDCSRYAAERLCQDEPHWKISIRGNDYTDLKRLTDCLKEEAAHGREPSSDAESKSSERRVMVRADGSAPYGFVQDIMGACASVGIYQIECGASQPPQQKDAQEEEAKG